MCERKSPSILELFVEVIGFFLVQLGTRAMLVLLCALIGAGIGAFFVEAKLGAVLGVVVGILANGALMMLYRDVLDFRARHK